jgi:cytochrome c-type biogenesis protein
LYLFPSHPSILPLFLKIDFRGGRFIALGTGADYTESMTEVSAIIAFGAGLLSFVSPCVLPLIPSYLFFIGGNLKNPEDAGNSAAAPEDAGHIPEKRPVLIRTIFFVLGFSVVFTTAGIVFSSLFIVSGVRYLDIAAGSIIIVFGLNTMFNFLSFVNYEKRFHTKGRSAAGCGGAFLVGAAFGAGWTPCVGPVLASIFLMAGQSGHLPVAALYLILYSAGLGLPFIAASLCFDRFLAETKKLKRHFPLIQKASGILLIITGLLVLSGRFQAIAALLQRLSG